MRSLTTCEKCWIFFASKLIKYWQKIKNIFTHLFICSFCQCFWHFILDIFDHLFHPPREHIPGGGDHCFACLLVVFYLYYLRWPFTHVVGIFIHGLNFQIMYPNSFGAPMQLMVSKIESVYLPPVENRMNLYSVLRPLYKWGGFWNINMKIPLEGFRIKYFETPKTQNCV